VTTGTAPRSRDSVATRAALLEAAVELFSNRGYEKTTVREIGERAGVDAALIARYFGNKANLYLATLTEDADSVRPSIDDFASYVEWVLERTDARGPGPIMQALLRADTAPEIREAARTHIEVRLVEPLVALLQQRKMPDARVRAEAAVAALFGVVLVRALGSLPAIGETDRGTLAHLLITMLESLCGSGAAQV
jgi:AcrR family transcriptional regulator